MTAPAPAAPRVITFGCRLNAYESEIILRNARDAGLEDAVIVNTCSVTREAVRQARQAIRRARREHPRARIVVTGCAAQTDPASFAAMPEVDRVLGNAEKMAAASFRDGGARGALAVSDIMAAPYAPAAAPLLSAFGERARAFVQVQQGCDHRCTFCIIPFARGPSHSVPPARVVEQVRALVAAGTREVVLTGVDICSYGADLGDPASLGGLARHILAEAPGLQRLRLSSLDPAAVDDEVFALLDTEPRLMPHLHLSLQAGCDLVLKRMKRRHVMADVEALCRRAREARPDAVFGADLIAGFPTESEAMFARSLDAVARLGLTYLHVFPYSPRPGTPAARMPLVPAALRRERAARLRQAGAAALARYLDGRVGTIARVLVEAGGEGRSEHYAPVRLAFEAAPGAVVATRITAVADGRLIGARAA